MLRIEEIVGAMDDEFRYALAVLDDVRLHHLLEHKSELRRMKPVGVSTTEAVDMIHAILEERIRKATALAERRRRAERVGQHRALRRLTAAMRPEEEPCAEEEVAIVTVPIEAAPDEPITGLSTGESYPSPVTAAVRRLTTALTALAGTVRPRH